MGTNDKDPMVEALKPIVIFLTLFVVLLGVQNLDRAKNLREYEQQISSYIDSDE